MPVRHSQVSGKAAPADDTVVSGPDWDDPHLFIPSTLTMSTVILTWTDQPAGVTEVFGNTGRRSFAVLTNAVDFRFYCVVTTASAAAGAVLYPQFSTDGTTWVDLQSGGTTTAGQADLTVTGTRITGWNAIAAGAKADPIFLRIAGKTGGTATGYPAIGAFGLVFR